MASRLLFISLVCSFIAADQVELFEGGHNDWKRQTHTGTLLGAWLCHLMYRIHWSKRCYTIYLCAYCHVIQGRERAGFSSRFFFFFDKGEAGCLSEVNPQNPCILRQGVCFFGRGLCSQRGFPHNCWQHPSNTLCRMQTLHHVFVWDLQVFVSWLFIYIQKHCINLSGIFVRNSLNLSWMLLLWWWRRHFWSGAK